jgi:hypothetical protein
MSVGRSHGDSHIPGSPTSPPVTLSPIKSHTQSNVAAARPKVLKPFAVTELKLLLLENISDEAVQAFRRNGFQVDHFTKAWQEDELVAKIGGYHAIGIRSKTKITERVLQAAPHVCDHTFHSMIFFSIIADIHINGRNTSIFSYWSLAASASGPIKSTCLRQRVVVYPYLTPLSPTRAPSLSSSSPKLLDSLDNYLIGRTRCVLELGIKFRKGAGKFEGKLSELLDTDISARNSQSSQKHLGCVFCTMTY